MDIARMACLPAIASLKPRPPMGVCTNRIVAWVDCSDVIGLPLSGRP